MPLRSLWPGSAYEIYAYATHRDRCQIEEFLTNLSKRDQKKMTALLTRAAHHGPPRFREKCQKMVGEHFWDVHSPPISSVSSGVTTQGNESEIVLLQRLYQEVWTNTKE